MAAKLTSGLSAGLNYARYIVLRNGGAIQSRGLRYSSTKTGSKSNVSKSDDGTSEGKEPLVGMSSDGSTLICWHPEPAHPYEHTRPICYTSQEAKEGDGKTPLKDQIIQKYLKRHRPVGPNIHELSYLTHTTKHRWYPKYVFIILGGNDISSTSTPGDIFFNLKGIVEELMTCGVERVFVASIPPRSRFPRDRFMSRMKFDAIRKGVNDKLRKKLPRAFVDLGKFLRFPAHFNSDGVHPDSKKGGLKQLQRAIKTSFSRTIPKSVVVLPK